jgi:GT2 family glycosyltransferase
VAFVDDDVRVAPEWAEALAAGLAAHPEASFLAGRIGAAPGEGTTEAPVAMLDRETPSSIDCGSTGTIAHSANLTVRRCALEAVGGFDEMLGAGAPLRAAEDADLLDRLLHNGFTGRYEPSARAWHLQWRRRSDLLRLYWAYGIGQGARLTKLARADRPRARREARIALWDRGFAEFGRDIRTRYEFGAALSFIQLGGLVVGAARGKLRRGTTAPVSPAGR